MTDTGAAGTTINEGPGGVSVNGTSGPLQINQRAGLSSGGVSLGDSGNMQSILSQVTIAEGDSTQPNTVVGFRDTSDTVVRTVSIATDAQGNTNVTGMSPGLIELVGNRFNSTFTAGTGGTRFQLGTTLSAAPGPTLSIVGKSTADVLVGPDMVNSWQITGTNSGTLNGNVTFSGIDNLQGGASADTFLFVSSSLSALLTGSIDGGAGVDTLAYTTNFWQHLPHDFAAGIAPLVGQGISNIENTPIDVVFGPSDQINEIGTTITDLPVTVPGELGSLSYAATGLPAGLTIDPQLGVISGTISLLAAEASPYQVTVTVLDGSDTLSVNFKWYIVAAPITLTNPGDQLTRAGILVNLPIQTHNPDGIPLTFSATNLPQNLSINPQTGVISGQLLFNPLDPSFSVTVSASGAGQSAWTTFHWTTQLGFSVAGIINQTNFDGDSVSVPITVVSPFGDDITTAISGLPPGVNFDPATMLISGTIEARAFLASPYQPLVTFTNHTLGYTYSETFQWSARSPFALATPDDQSSTEGTLVSVPISVTRDAGQSVTFSAANLPAGLSIDPSSGVISGVDAAGSAGSTTSPSRPAMAAIPGKYRSRGPSNRRLC